MKNFLKKFQTIMYECFVLRILTFTRFALSICFIGRLSHIVDKDLSDDEILRYFNQSHYDDAANQFNGILRRGCRRGTIPS